ncbi:Cpr100A [Drosophila busckii]|uniref:Cpr100A n=1 Tax=Drosophila busckii TaxID=30019 RepID=A0A0M4F3W3_DROBS|nr:protein transport protein SEC24 [Drosophila busckii]ALC46350.1 Cpr100A [Drosophila busckii]
MFRFLALTTLVALTVAQNYHQDPKTAAIISEQRYLSGDGKFGAAYTQEDGINFKEETDADGTRHGSYSYVDPSGQRRTISYTAGKNGFQASGDHLPVAPPAPPQPVPTSGYQPQQQYQPQSQYQPQQQYQAPAPQSSFRSNDYGDDGSYDTRYNDPSFGQSQQSYQQPAQPQYRPAPAPVQPAYNPQPAYQPAPAQQPQYQPQQQQAYYTTTTPNPHRFSPPGKLSLNRTPDGFTYSFNKV